MAERGKDGRVIPGTGSLNPGGESKLVRKARKMLQRGAAEGAEYLLTVIRGEAVDEMPTKFGVITVKARTKDRVAAVKVAYEYTITKPKTQIEVDDKRRPFAEKTAEELLAAYDSLQAKREADEPH